MSGIRSLLRNSTLIGYATPKSAPIYVDADDNRVKLIPAGSGTTEVVLQETSGSGVAEVVTATNVLTAAESGKTFFLSAAGGFATTLPAAALGLRFTFFVKVAPSGGSYTIVGPSANIHGVAVSSADAGGSAGATVGTPVLTITLVDGQSTIGDKVVVECDGTSYFATAFIADEDAVTFA